MTSPTTPPVAPTMNSLSSRHSRKTLPLTIIALVLGIIAVAVLAFFPVGGDTFWHRLYAVHTLSTVNMVETRPNQGLFSFGLKGPTPVRVAGVTDELDDYAQTGRTSVAITRNLSTSEMQVVLLGSKPQTIIKGDGKGLYSLAISPDESMVAFSIMSSTSEATNMLSGWNLVLVSLKDNKQTVLGPGYGASFFVRDGKTWLLSTTASGIRITDPEALTSFITPLPFKDTLLFAAQISSDGSHVAMRDAATSALSLFDVTQIKAGLPIGITITKTGFMNFYSVVLGKNALYGIEQVDPMHSLIREIPYGGTAPGKILYELPDTASYRLIAS